MGAWETQLDNTTHFGHRQAALPRGPRAHLRA